MNVSAVTNHFPTANKGFITTTSSTITSGVAQTTVPLTSVAGLTNGSIFVGLLSPSTTSEREFTGVVDTAGSQITGVKWTDGTDGTHTAGTTIVDYVSATGQNMQTKGFLVAHDQDGTLKADSVDVTAVIKDGIITNAKLVDGTITEAKTNTKPSEFLSDFIASGGVVAQSAGLVGTFSNIVYYISGVRYTATSVANKTYTASKDTYVDINSSGTPTYTEVANNAASPALTAGYIRVAIVTTNGSAITNVNQGETTQAVPTVSSVPLSVSDSLGNLICNRSPVVRLLGLRQITGASSTASTSPTAITAFSITTTIPAGRRAKIAIAGDSIENNAINSYAQLTIWSGVVGSGTQLQRLVVREGIASMPTAAQCSIVVTGDGTSKTYNGAINALVSGTAQLNANPTYPAQFTVELL